MPAYSEKLFFSDNDFSKIEWIEDGREFEHNGKLYDVAKIERTAMGFDVYCVNDSAEESFIAMVDHWKKSNSSGGKTKTIFQPQFCNSLNCNSIERDIVEQTKSLFTSIIYQAPTSPAPSPPPKFHS